MSSSAEALQPEVRVAERHALWPGAHLHSTGTSFTNATAGGGCQRLLRATGWQSRPKGRAWCGG
jgi:hypothetical protein